MRQSSKWEPLLTSELFNLKQYNKKTSQTVETVNVPAGIGGERETDRQRQRVFEVVAWPHNVLVIKALYIVSDNLIVKGAFSSCCSLCRCSFDVLTIEAVSSS